MASRKTKITKDEATEVTTSETSNRRTYTTSKNVDVTPESLEAPKAKRKKTSIKPTEKLPNVTRKDLAYRLQSIYGIDGVLAKKFIEALFDEINHQLLQGQTVKLTSFGTFSISSKRPRPGRNLLTGEPVTITARKVVRFKASRKLRSATDHTVDDLED